MPPNLALRAKPPEGAIPQGDFLQGGKPGAALRFPRSHAASDRHDLGFFGHYKLVDFRDELVRQFLNVVTCTALVVF